MFYHTYLPTYHDNSLYKLIVFKLSFESIQLLLSSYPDAVKLKDNNGNLPLHLSIIEKSSIEIIQLLLSSYPDAIKVKNNDDYLPLHLSIIEKSSIEIIQLLLSSYPDAIEVKNYYGNYPLHLSIIEKSSFEIIRLLLSSYPDAIKVNNNNGNFPLHLSIIEISSFKVIQLLLSNYPDAMKLKGSNGNLPLHVAILKKSSFEIIQLLLSSYPDAINLEVNNGYNSNYYLPLHLAVMKKSSFVIIQLLLFTYPDAIKVKDYSGNYPLHLSIIYKSSIEIIQLLLSNYPDAIKVNNNNGNFSLHLSIIAKSSIEIIQLLLSNYPDAIKVNNNNGNYPLHLSIIEKSSFESIQLLLLSYPDAIKLKGNDGNLPLHVAILKKSSIEIIQLLLSSYPDAINLDVNNGYNSNYYLPLHLAIINKSSFEIIQLLLSSYPDAIKVKNNDDYLPLHLSIIEKSSFEIIKLLLSSYPDALKVERDYGFKLSSNLPLHSSIIEKSSYEVIQLLLSTYPDAIKRKGENGYLPLYLSIMKKSSFEIIQLLLGYPDAIKLKDRNGNLPLHLSIIEKSSIEIIQLLLSSYPDAIQAKNYNGNLPLHVAILKKSSFEIIQLLLSSYPDALKVNVCYHGDLPLHLATIEKSSLEIIQLLLSIYPDAIRVKGKNGNLPLHSSIINKSSLEIIQLLLSSYPDAIQAKVNYSDPPLHLSIIEKSSIEIIKLLLLCYPEAIKLKGNNGNLPLHLSIIYKSSIEIIQLLLSSYPDAIKVKNYSGNYPLHLSIIEKSSIEIIQLLLSNFTDAIKVKNFYGNYPLHLSIIEKSSFEIIQLLLSSYPPSAHSGLEGNHFISGDFSLHDFSKYLNYDGDYWKLFLHNKSSIAAYNIHLCGNPLAGKSVVFYWLQKCLKELDYFWKTKSWFKDYKYIPVDDSGRSRGMESALVMSKGVINQSTSRSTSDVDSTSNRLCNFILRDYGGHYEYLISHCDFLKMEDSFYIIMLPLCNASIDPPAPFSQDKIIEDYLFWLRFIYTARQGLLKTKNIGDLKEISNVSTTIPILTVINIFSSHDKNKKSELSSKLKSKALELFPNDDKEVSILEPLIIDAKVSVDCSNISSVIASYIRSNMSNASSSLKPYHSYLSRFVYDGILRYNEQQKVDSQSIDKIIILWKDLKTIIISILQSYPPVQTSTLESMWLDCLKNALLNTAVKDLIEAGKILCLRNKNEMLSFSISNSNKYDNLRIIRNTSYYFDENDYFVINPDSLTKSFIGNIIHDVYNNYRKTLEPDALKVSSTDILEILNNYKISTGDIPPARLLVALGLAVFVYQPNLVSNSNDEYWLIGLIDSKFEEANSEMTKLDPTLDRVVSRVFRIKNNKMVFIPSYFSKLFIHIYYKENLDKLPSCVSFWSDGMHLIIEKSFKSIMNGNKTSKGGRYTKQIIIKPVKPEEGKMIEGFEVIVATKNVPFSSEYEDVAMNDMNYIREFIHSQDGGNIEVDEYCLNATTMKYPKRLIEIEEKWKGSDEERDSAFSWYMGRVPDNIEQVQILNNIHSKLSDQDVLSTVRHDEVMNGLRKYEEWDFLLNHIMMLVKEVGQSSQTIIENNDKNNEKIMSSLKNNLNTVDQTKSKIILEINKSRDDIKDVLKNHVENVIIEEVSQSKSQIIVEFSKTRDDLKDALNLLNTIHNNNIWKERGIGVFPLFPVVRFPAATGLKGSLERIIADVCSIQFVCPVCGSIPKIINEKNEECEFKGFKIKALKEWSRKMLKAISISLFIVQIALTAVGIPNGASSAVSMICEKGFDYVTKIDPEIMKVINENCIESYI
eukprot:gene6848-9375_t